MRLRGTLIGLVVGLLLFRHPVGAVIGGLVGYAVDAGWFATPARTLRDRRYQTLGLTADASNDEIERAYRRLISQYHPDKVAGAAEEIRRIAEQRAGEINAAYEAICRERAVRP